MRIKNAVTFTIAVLIVIKDYIHPHCVIPFEVTCVVDEETVELIIFQDRVAVASMRVILKGKSWWAARKKCNIDEHWSGEEV